MYGLLTFLIRVHRCQNSLEYVTSWRRLATCAWFKEDDFLSINRELPSPWYESERRLKLMFHDVFQPLHVLFLLSIGLLMLIEI